MESGKIAGLVMVGVVMLMPFGAIPLLRSVERQKKEWDARPAPSLPKVYVSDERAIWVQLVMLGLFVLIFMVPGAAFAVTLFALAWTYPLALVVALAVTALLGFLVWGLWRGVKKEFYRLAHPDRLVLSAEGVCCDSLGVQRQWRWDEIEGAGCRFISASYHIRNFLVLKLRPGAGPQHVRGEPRFGRCNQAVLPQYWKGARLNSDVSADIAADIRAVIRSQGREPLSAWLESQDWPGQAQASRQFSQ